MMLPLPCAPPVLETSLQKKKKRIWGLGQARGGNAGKCQYGA